MARLRGWGALALLASVAGAACGGPGGDQAPPLDVDRAAVWPTATMATLGFRLRSAEADTLDGVQVDGAGSVSLHRAGTGGRGMIPAAEIPIEPRTEIVFTEGRPHVMITGLPAPLAVGDSVKVVLHFRRAGDVSLMVPVLRYTEAVRRIGT